MPEQVTEEVKANVLLKQAIQDSQIRRIHLRSIESRIENEIQDLKTAWLIPKSQQKAGMLEAAKDLVAKVKRDLEEEQKRFEKEMKEDKGGG